MIDRDIATLAMINVSNGKATEEEKYLVDNMEEALFSDIYSELENLVRDTNYGIEDYYKVKSEISIVPETREYVPSSIPKLDREEKYKVEEEFEEFLKEFGEEYDSVESAYKDFLENYCSLTSDREYSDDFDLEPEIENLIVDEFTDFLVNHGRDYSDPDEAYDDYIRNYCNYL